MLEFVNVTFVNRFNLDGSTEEKEVSRTYPGIRLSGCVLEKDAIVYIGNCVIGEFVIERLNSSSAMKLVNLRVTGQLTIEDSNLGGAELNNVSLDGAGLLKAPAVTIAFSSFHDTLFNNVRWGDVSRIKAGRDTFRQLKAAHDDIGNHLQANEFYGMEMHEYGEEIAGRRGREKGRIQERIEFWLGKYVSNFSNNWWRPLWLFLVFSYICFLATDFISGTCQYAHYYEWYWKPVPDLEQYLFPHFFAWLFIPLAKTAYLFLYPSWDIADEFVKFVNPFAHSSEGLEGKDAALWLFHKLGGAFIVYQFLMALRRKTKR